MIKHLWLIQKGKFVSKRFVTFWIKNFHFEYFTLFEDFEVIQEKRYEKKLLLSIFITFLNYKVTTLTQFPLTRIPLICNFFHVPKSA